MQTQCKVIFTREYTHPLRLCVPWQSVLRMHKALVTSSTTKIYIPKKRPVQDGLQKVPRGAIPFHEESYNVDEQ